MRSARSAVVMAAAALITALSQAPAVAHGAAPGSGSGVAAPLIVAGAVLAVVGLTTRARGAVPPWVGLSILGVGILTIASAFVLVDDKPAAPDVHMAIIEPPAGTTVPAGQAIPVAVAIDAGVLATGPADKDGGHLHLSVDGKLQQMPYATETTVTLTRGTHTLTVEYVDNRHISYKPKVEHSVQVTAA